MNTYKRHRFPLDIISYAVWLYYRFNLSHRDIEDLLAERGIIVTRESIRLWCIKFGALYARRLKRKHRGYGDTFYIDEVFVKINGKQHYLWRAVDQDGEVVDVYLQARRDGSAALDLCYVACGRFDGFWELGLNPWDTAAAVLILKEAGGQVSTFTGDEYSIYEKEILASNSIVHEQMIEILAIED